MVSHAGFEGKVPGGFGVTIFFFLSGYLITSLLRIEFANSGKLDIRAFYFRRVLRIMPPLYVTLVILTALYPMGIFGRTVNWVAVPWDYLFLSNYSYLWGQSGGLPVPLWSLAIEEHFYLLAPVAILGLLRWRRPDQVAAICAVGCLIELLIRLGVLMFLPDAIEHNYYWSHTRLDSILFGCSLALFQNPLLDKDAWRPTRLHVVVASLGIVGTFLVGGQAFRETVRYSIQGAALFVLFSFALSGQSSPLNRALTWQPLRWIGFISFSLYLCHIAIYRALIAMFGVSPPMAGLIGFPIALLYAQAMRSFVELPILRWRRKNRTLLKSADEGSAIADDDVPSDAVFVPARPAVQRYANARTIEAPAQMG